LQVAVRVYESLSALEDQVRQAAQWCIEALASGNKLLVCGNGGSAAEAQHMAGELMGQYREPRRPFAAVALTADSALMTCLGNDFCFDEVFARQVRALARPGDVLIAFSTSGASPNILKALQAARELGLRSIALLGREGGAARDLAGCSLIVRHDETARVQEAHQFLMHAIIDEIEAGLHEPR
jgi:D-sedoheptulose 7-phosphate isomerase